MRYVQGLAVAALMVVGYLVATGGLTASPPVGVPSPTVPTDSLAPVYFTTPAPRHTFPPLYFDTPPPIPASELPTLPPRPTHHVLQRGPPLH